MTPKLLSADVLGECLRLVGGPAPTCGGLPNTEAALRAHIAALEADNAALLLAVRRAMEWCPVGGAAEEVVTAAVEQAHPGAHLLAEHAKALGRAMHNGLQRAKSAVKTAVAMGLIGHGPADRLAAMIDAMKEPEA